MYDNKDYPIKLIFLVYKDIGNWKKLSNGMQRESNKQLEIQFHKFVCS